MILLLGASGLLGHNVLKLLLQKGQRVRCILRDGATIDPAVLAEDRGGQIDCVRGSVLDERLLEKSLQGCSAVVNCAGVTDMTLSRIEDYRPMNARLPLTLARLIDDTGGGVLVSVSTANTVDPGTPGSPSTEDSPFGGPFAASLYARSKREGEQALERFAEEHLRTRVVILLPGFIIGPYDRKPSSGQLLLAGYRKPVMAAPAGGKTFIDARDIAVAVLGAIENQLAKGRYLVTGRSLSLRDFYALQAKVCGYRQVFLPLPRSLCLAVGSVGDKLERRGKRTQAVSRNIRQLLVGEYYDDSRARRELGLPRTPLEDSINAFFDYHGR